MSFDQIGIKGWLGRVRAHGGRSPRRSWRERGAGGRGGRRGGDPRRRAPRWRWPAPARGGVAAGRRRAAVGDAVVRRGGAAPVGGRLGAGGGEGRGGGDWARAGPPRARRAGGGGRPEGDVAAPDSLRPSVEMCPARTDTSGAAQGKFLGFRLREKFGGLTYK